MRSTRLITMIVGLALFASPTAMAGEFDLDWYTIASGGDMWTTGGSIELSGTIGQTSAGGVLTGGNFTVQGGFWLAASPTCLGDANCDGEVNFDDINPFVAALSGAAPCFFPNVDINSDGFIDFDDINPFVGIMSGGGTCP